MPCARSGGTSFGWFSGRRSSGRCARPSRGGARSRLPRRVASAAERESPADEVARRHRLALQAARSLSAYEGVGAEGGGAHAAGVLALHGGIANPRGGSSDDASAADLTGAVAGSAAGKWRAAAVRRARGARRVRGVPEGHAALLPVRAIAVAVAPEYVRAATRIGRARYRNLAALRGLDAADLSLRSAAAGV